jgi:hypothetical protein
MMLSKGALEMIAWCAAGCPLPSDERKPEPVRDDPVPDAPNDPAIIPADCIGALIDPDGGRYLPWGPRLSPEDVRLLRADLGAVITELATLEGWSRATLDEVLAGARWVSGATLVSDVGYFGQRLLVVRAEIDDRFGRRARVWRMEGFERRHYCAGCNGECIGTSKSCTRHA